MHMMYSTAEAIMSDTFNKFNGMPLNSNYTLYAGNRTYPATIPISRRAPRLSVADVGLILSANFSQNTCITLELRSPVRTNSWI